MTTFCNRWLSYLSTCLLLSFLNTVIWTSAPANVFLFNYAAFIKQIREDLRKHKNLGSLVWYSLSKYKFYSERSETEWKCVWLCNAFFFEVIFQRSIMTAFLMVIVVKNELWSIASGSTVSWHVSVIQMLNDT